jgi:Asp/Glu/hydantoin racemase
VTEKVAILHTSMVFLSVEPVINDLIAELLPGVEVMHFVDSDVLATVNRDGVISPASEARMTNMALSAQEAGADIIFSACSSLGPALDVAARRVRIPVVKIDEAMANLAAGFSRVGILATVRSTLQPTSDLIAASADLADRDIHIETRLADGAFEALMSGDRGRHDELVEAAAVELAGQVDVVVLAQASMSRLVDALATSTGRPVLTSPRLGVGELARRLSEIAISH